MRKIFTLLLMLAIGFQLMAQKGFEPVKRNPDFAKPGKTIHSGIKAKAPGDVIFSEDFDGAEWAATSDNGEPAPENAPGDWVIIDLNDTNFCWRWDTIGPRGIFTNPEGSSGDCTLPNEPMLSTTGQNGFMMIEADWFNSAADCSEYYTVGMDTYLQYEGGLDFTNVDAVHLLFEQVNRLCCGFNENSDLWFSISTDNGTTWEQLSVHYAPLGSGLGRLGQPAEFTEFDITNMVAGHSNVWFRFHMEGLTHYYWIIDDVTIFEPEANDIQFLDYWNDYITYMDGSDDNTTIQTSYDFTEGFYEYPWFLSQAYRGFHAAYINFGGQPQTNLIHNVEIWKDGSLLTSFESDPVTNVPIAYVDTTMIQQSYNPVIYATNNELGNYTFLHYPSTDNIDDVPSNDTLIRYFKIGENLVKVADFDKTNDHISPDNWTSFDEDGDGLGFMINIPEPTLFGGEFEFYELNGVHIFIDRNNYDPDQLALFENEEAKAVAGLYKYDEENDTYTEHISSAEYTFDISDTMSVVFLEFAKDGTSEYLFEGGQYIVTLNMYGTFVNTFGALQSWDIRNADNSVQKRSKESCLTVNASISSSSDIGWVGEGPAMALDISVAEPIPNSPYINFYVRTEEGNYIENAFIELTNPINTAVTIASGYTNMNGMFGFKVSENESFDFNYSVSHEDFSNVVGSNSFVINSNLSIEVTMNPLGIQNASISDISIYPNPSNGIFNIACEGTFNVQILDMSGKVVFESKVASRETVDLRNKTRGVYLVKAMNNTQEVTKTIIVN